MKDLIGDFFADAKRLHIGIAIVKFVCICAVFVDGYFSVLAVDLCSDVRFVAPYRFDEELGSVVGIAVVIKDIAV